VYLYHLSLTNFRNYTRLELDFPGRITLLQGANAQGKTNLLEAIHYLATGRSPQAGVERELVNWLALEEPIPYARAVADIAQDHQRERLEITLIKADGPGRQPSFHKQVRINGVARRALDLIGHLRVVLFVPQDIELVAGPPGHRRRYLDVALCQMSRAYCRALATYNQVLAQRNALLRALRERNGDREQLHFWDEQLVEQGTLLMMERQRFIASLDIEARARHRELTSGREHLRLHYLPSFDPAHPPQANFQLPLALEPGQLPPASLPSQVETKERFTAYLKASQRQDVAAGMTLVGPHRDDLRFTVGGHDLRVYGSRGQQRTATLALKLAEVQVMTRETGQPPLLLLDDIMSELDAARRQMLLSVLDGVSQAIITTTDWDDFTPEFRAQARLLRLLDGKVEEVSPGEG
jgi:DNA replication and repair protein RecF